MKLRTTVAAATISALAAGSVAAVAQTGFPFIGALAPEADVTFATVEADDGRTLVTFGQDASTRRVSIKGLSTGERVVGIDVRPATGALYGVSSANRVFVINPRNGQTSAAVPLTVAGGAPLALNGSGFGVDFNPQVDRLRVVSSFRQNLRIDVTTGITAVDTPLAYPAGDRNVNSPTDVSAVAYTPSTPGGTPATPGGPTALYDLDSGSDTFALQNPPNGGGLQSIGPIGVDVGLSAGYDIIARRGSFTGFSLLQDGNRGRLYVHDLNRNGAAVQTSTSLRGAYVGLAALPEDFDNDRNE